MDRHRKRKGQKEELASFSTWLQCISRSHHISRDAVRTPLSPIPVISVSSFLCVSGFTGLLRLPLFCLLSSLGLALAPSPLRCSFLTMLTWFLMQKARAVLILNIWRETWGKSSCTLICFYFQLQFKHPDYKSRARISIKDPLSPDSPAFFLSISQKEFHPYTCPDPHSKLLAVLYWGCGGGSCDKTDPISKWSAVCRSDVFQQGRRRKDYAK